MSSKKAETTKQPVSSNSAPVKMELMRLKAGDKIKLERRDKNLAPRSGYFITQIYNLRKSKCFVCVDGKMDTRGQDFGIIKKHNSNFFKSYPWAGYLIHTDNNYVQCLEVIDSYVQAAAYHRINTVCYFICRKTALSTDSPRVKQEKKKTMVLCLLSCLEKVRPFGSVEVKMTQHGDKNNQTVWTVETVEEINLNEFLEKFVADELSVVVKYTFEMKVNVTPKTSPPNFIPIGKFTLVDMGKSGFLGKVKSQTKEYYKQYCSGDGFLYLICTELTHEQRSFVESIAYPVPIMSAKSIRKEIDFENPSHERKRTFCLSGFEAKEDSFLQSLILSGGGEQVSMHKKKRESCPDFLVVNTSKAGWKETPKVKLAVMHQIKMVHYKFVIDFAQFNPETFYHVNNYLVTNQPGYSPLVVEENLTVIPISPNATITSHTEQFATPEASLLGPGTSSVSTPVNQTVSSSSDDSSPENTD